MIRFIVVAVSLLLPMTALAEPYQVPQQPLFTKPIPVCVHKDILFKTLTAATHHISWTGLDESHPARLALYSHQKSGTWFLVAIRTDSVLACVMARGNESRLHFGEPM